MRIAVVGTGYVGLVTGAGFADFGHDVTCVDIDETRVQKLRAGEVPFYEPGLHDLIKRNTTLERLRFTTSTREAVEGAQIAFIAVGTPSTPDGSANLQYVLDAAKAIGESMTGFTVIVTKSTVPVGTGDKVHEVVKSVAKYPFAVASNPEFLKEGDAVNDFRKPARVVVGVDNPKALEVLREVYRGVVRTNDRLHVMDIHSAEITKYASNCMLAVRISFMNELSRLCETVGADIEAIRKGMGSDPRIGNKFLFAGAGFGGSCLVGHETVLVRDGSGVRLVALSSLFATKPEAPATVIEHPELEVLAWTGEHGGARFLPVHAITRRAYEGEIVEVRTKMGRRLACTLDHPFIVTDERGETTRIVTADQLDHQAWLPIITQGADNAVQHQERFTVLDDLLATGVPADEVLVRIGEERARSNDVTEALRSVVRDKNRLADIRRSGTLRLDELHAARLDANGATIGTSRSGTYIPVTLPNNEAIWRVLGLYCAEGWITTDLGRDGARRMRISWAFHPRDEHFLVEEVRAFWESFGIKASVYAKLTTTMVTVSSRLLATWLQHSLGLGANCYDQRIPDALWTANEASKRAFLSGLWHGDGSWSYVGNRRGVVLEYGTVSRAMADGVLRLLAELGVVASWKVGRPPGSTVPTHFIRVSGANQVERLLELCKEPDRDLVVQSIATQTKRIAPTGYRVDANVHRVRIVETRRLPFQGFVYSLEVPGSETFVTTGGLVVHNCFPKDLRALVHTGLEHDVSLGVVDAAIRANEKQKRVLGEKVLAHFNGNLNGKKIAIWGLAFKPETDDIRESPALVVIEQLQKAGATITGYDPEAMPNIKAQLGDTIELTKDAYSAAAGADAVVLVTEWHELRNPELARLRSVMKSPVLFDGRNVWIPEEVRAAGFTYYGIGRP